MSGPICTVNVLIEYNTNNNLQNDIVKIIPIKVLLEGLCIFPIS